MNPAQRAEAAAIVMEDRFRRWSIARAPRTAALYVRLLEVQLRLPSHAKTDVGWIRLHAEIHRGLRDLAITLGAALNHGREVDDDFAAEAVEMLVRAEKAAAKVSA